MLFTVLSNTNIQEMARCSVTDSNNDQLYKKPECHEEKGKINAHLEQDKLTGATNVLVDKLHMPVFAMF
jgi:hypothetical protein